MIVPLSYKDVSEIVKIIDASTLDELVIELPDIKLVIRRRGADTGPVDPGFLRAAPAAADSLAPPLPAKPPAPSSPVPTPSRTDGAYEIRAPMVGTFYRAPSPKDSPFVEVGSVVKPGQPLCLIEVMKLYTTIEAKQPGKIVDIPAINGALVEYDQVLFVIAPL